MRLKTFVFASLVPIAGIVLLLLSKHSAFMPQYAHIAIMVILSFSALSMVYLFFRTVPAEEADGLKKILRKTIIDYQSRNDDLQRKINFLTAEKEISLVIAASTEYESTTSRVLDIVSTLFDPPPKSVSIFCRNDTGEIRRVRRDAKGVTFDQLSDFDDSVGSAISTGQISIVSDPDIMNITLPLSADGKIIGAMKVEVPNNGTVKQNAAGMQESVSDLGELARIVSLGVKAPDLYTKATTDGLTGLSTKRHFLEQFKQMFEFAKRYPDVGLSIAMIDIDHFKKVNDTYGHQAGDIALKEVASIVSKNTRKSGDLAFSAYRYGGEEMCIVMPKASLDAAGKVVERIRKTIEARRIKVPGGKVIKITASFGVASISPSVNQPNELVENADKALYHAKESGRNRVISFCESGFVNCSQQECEIKN